MATNQTTIGTTHNLLNYFGIIFNKGNVGTPFIDSISAPKSSDSFVFPTSQTITSGGGSSQPAITETASLTAPNPSFIARTQQKNYCQIFQYTYGLSYAKKSAQGMLSGINTAGTEANPADEMAFQAAQKIIEMRNDMEYSFLNGTGQEGTYDDVPYKTQGITGAITTNTIAAGNTDLNYWMIAEAIQKIHASYAPTDGLILSCRSAALLSLNASLVKAGLAVTPADRTVSGVAMQRLVTPFGTIFILPNERVASGTALIYNPSVCAPVLMPIENGQYVVDEPLAKVGAGDKRQLYAQAGLDYGAEWCHAKITGLTTSFTRPSSSIDVNVVNPTTAPVNTKEVQ